MATIGAKRQDMPPEGGYNPISYKRIPARSYFGGWSIMSGYLVMTTISAYIYYLTCKSIHKEDIEMRAGRLAIFPLLLAERDREYLKQLRKNREEEKELMANVEGWKVGTYYGQELFKTIPKDKWYDPTYQGYYVHASIKDMDKRLFLASWS